MNESYILKPMTSLQHFSLYVARESLKIYICLHEQSSRGLVLQYAMFLYWCLLMLF